MGAGADKSSPSLKSWIYPHNATVLSKKRNVLVCCQKSSPDGESRLKPIQTKTLAAPKTARAKNIRTKKCGPMSRI